MPFAWLSLCYAKIEGTCRAEARVLLNGGARLVELWLWLRPAWSACRTAAAMESWSRRVYTRRHKSRPTVIGCWRAERMPNRSVRTAAAATPTTAATTMTAIKATTATTVATTTTTAASTTAAVGASAGRRAERSRGLRQRPQHCWQQRMSNGKIARMRDS